MPDPKAQPTPRRNPARRPATTSPRAKRSSALAGPPGLRRWGAAILGGVALVVGIPIAVALVGEIGAVIILAFVAGLVIGRAWR